MDSCSAGASTGRVIALLTGTRLPNTFGEFRTTFAVVGSGM